MTDEPNKALTDAERAQIMCAGRKLEDVLAQLSLPFRIRDLEWKVGSTTKSGRNGPACMMLTYITRVAVIRRFNEVVGAHNWRQEFREHHAGTICRLGLRCYGASKFGVLPGVDWLWKEDGAGETDIEATKGGIANALKRAAGAWGIGLYLYDLDKTWIEGKLDSRDKVRPANFKYRDECVQKFRAGARPEWLHPDDRQGGQRQQQQRPAQQQQQPSSQPEGGSDPAKQIRFATEPPEWIGEKLGGKQWPEMTWEWVCKPSEGGERKRWLEFQATEGHNKVINRRAKAVLYLQAKGRWIVADESLDAVDVVARLKEGTKG